MKRICKSVGLLIALVCTPTGTPRALAGEQSGSGETQGYRLVWQDLFDNGELNTQRWNIEVNGDGGGNNELQYYTGSDSNVRVGDDGEGNGCLIITARRENRNGKNFTSGRINSKNKVAFTHGKVEASIKLPKTANGLWPAFWMLGNDFDRVGWPACGEIDILEMGHADGIAAGRQDRYFNGACHWGPYWPNASDAQAFTSPYSLQDGEFHLYTCIWDDTEIRMYLDLDKYPTRAPYYTINITEINPANGYAPGNYFHKDMFIIFNLAIGGSFPGIYDASGITALNSANGQQASMYVDYVKVYQKGTGSDHFFSLVAGDSSESEDDADEDNKEEETLPIYAASTIIPGLSQTYDVVCAADEVIAGLSASGQTVNDIRTDDSSRFLYIWEGTYTAGSSSYPGVGFNSGHRQGYPSLTVANTGMGWSGAGFYIEDSFDNRHWNENTALHVVYRTEGTAPASIGFKIAEDDNTINAARFAAGREFNDNGVIYPALAPAANSQWQCADISFNQIKDALGYFDYTSSARWKGNILSILGGGTAGRNISIDCVFFHTPPAGTLGIGDSLDDSLECSSVEIFDLSGRPVARKATAKEACESLVPGIYIVKEGSRSRKIIKK